MKSKYELWMGEPENRFRLTLWIGLALSIIGLVLTFLTTIGAGLIWGTISIVFAFVVLGLNTYYVSNDDHR